LTTVLYICIYGYTPITSSYANYMHASATLVGLIGSAYAISQVLFKLPSGILADKIGKHKPIVIACLAIGFLAPILSIFIHSPLVLFISRILTGIGVAAWIQIIMIFSSYFPSERSANSVGIISIACYLGQFLGTFFGSVLAESFGYLAPFYFSAMAGAAGFLISLFIKEKPIDMSTVKPFSLKDLLPIASDKNLILLTTFSAIAIFALFTSSFGFTPLIAEELFNANKFQVGLITAIVTAVPMLASYLCARITPKTRIRRLVVWSLVLCGIFCMLTPFSPSLFILYLLQAVIGFTANLVVVILMPFSMMSFPPEKKTTALSFYQAFFCLGAAIGPWVIGFILDVSGSYVVGFTIVCVLCLACAGLCLMSYTKGPGMNIKKKRGDGQLFVK